MKRSADSDNNTVEIQIRIDKRTIVRDEHRLVSYLLQWFFLFLYQKYGWIYGNLTQNEYDDWKFYMDLTFSWG